MSRIFLINQYSSTPETGQGGRTYYFAGVLADKGHDVTLIAARHHHLLGDPKADLDLIEQVNGFTYRRIGVPKFEHAHDKRRILAWFVFAWNIARFDYDKYGKPDVILYSSPSLFGFLGAKRLARKTGARLIFEVRDIWPQTLMDLGGYSKRHPMIRFMQWIEDRAYQRADAVISNLEGAVKHMKKRGMNPVKFSWVPNGFLEAEANQKHPLSQEINNLIPTDKFTIGYAGTLGIANSVDTLIQAARILKNQDNIIFVIVGEGRDKDSLQQLAQKDDLQNIIFVPAVPKKQVQTVLSKFTICYLAAKKSNLYENGVAANKIFDYLYAGKPIIHSYSGGYDPITKYNAGFGIEAENPQLLSETILKMYNLPQEERDAMGLNGHAASMKHHEYKQLTEKLEKILLPKDKADHKN